MFESVQKLVHFFGNFTMLLWVSNSPILSQIFFVNLPLEYSITYWSPSTPSKRICWVQFNWLCTELLYHTNYQITQLEMDLTNSQFIVPLTVQQTALLLILIIFEHMRYRCIITLWHKPYSCILFIKNLKRSMSLGHVQQNLFIHHILQCY